MQPTAGHKPGKMQSEFHIEPGEVFLPGFLLGETNTIDPDGIREKEGNMSHNKPSIESVFHALVLLKTYCHYQSCCDCAFHVDSLLVNKNKVSGKTCFFNNGPDGWEVDDYILICDLIENIFFPFHKKIEKSFVKYKIAYKLLKDWKENHSQKNFHQYRDYIKTKKVLYYKSFLVEICKDE
jgi:hypothetical protein